MSDIGNQSHNDTKIDPVMAPEVPRPLTPRALSHIMKEPNVRFWWILAALMVAATIGFSISGLLKWRDDAAMIGAGPAVQATGWIAGGARVKGQALRAGEGISVDIEYEFEGKKFKSLGPLVQTGKEYRSGTPFEIRLKPGDPTVWTNRNQPVPFWEEMIAAFIAMVAALGCLCAAILVRMRFRLLWITGEQRTARVVDHRQNALAPKSVVLVCAIRQARQEMLVSVLVPHNDAVPSVGQNIELIVNESLTTAIAVTNYHP